MNSLPCLPVPCKACVYSTVVSVPLCCLASMLRALVGLALTSKRGLPISRPSHHHQTRSLLPLPSRAYNTAYSTCPLDDKTSQHGRHGRDGSKRKVRGADRVEAVLQPLSQCDCPASPSCPSACLPPPPRRTEAACGSHVLPCMMAAPASAALCPPSARLLLALLAIITPPPTTSSVHALPQLPLASEARNGRPLVLSR